MQCASCGKSYQEVDQLRKCSRCGLVVYCSKACQRGHWTQHRFLCQPKSKEGAQNNHEREKRGRIKKLQNEELDDVITSDEADAVLIKAEDIQRQHEILQAELDETMKLLFDSLRKFEVPLPARRVHSPHKRLSQLKTQENMRSLMERCTSDSVEMRLEATKECRKLLSDQSPPIKELVDMGLVPIFIGFLKDDTSPKLQFEAAWVLTNICSGTSEQTEAVVKCGAVSLLIDLLNSEDEELAEQCVWALGNIAADSPTCRDILLDSNVVESLLPLMDSKRVTMLKNISWTMSNLCNGVQDIHWPKVLQALPKFSKLVYYNDEDILKDVCWSLSCISSGTKDRIQAIVDLDPGICKRLIDLLIHNSTSVQHAALITVGNIVTGDDEQTQVLINHQILVRLRRLLSHSKTSILKDACFTISNIAAGNMLQIQAIIEAKIIPALILLYTTANKLDIKVEATWALSNALSNGSEDQIKYLVEQGCVKPMCELMPCYDYCTIEAVFEGLENILKAGESQQKRTNGSINPMACHIKQQAGTTLARIQLEESCLEAKRERILQRINVGEQLEE